MFLLTPRRIGVEKYFESVTLDLTYEHSMIPVSPFNALINEIPNRAPAKAMDKVADPVPALALTTSVPASWILSVSAFSWLSGKETDGVHCEINGIIVMPLCPPITGTLTFNGSSP